MAVGTVADRAGNTAAANNPDTLVAASDDSMTRSVEDAAAVEALDELEKEVGIMARLRHPNIVLLLGAVRSPPAIVEEFCARGSLFSVLQRHTKPGVPPLEWRVRLQMALGAAAGMCYLHNCSPPIIHRDLKSPNLMVDRYFRVKVGDFNLSRVAVPRSGRSTPGWRSVRVAAYIRRAGWLPRFFSRHRILAPRMFTPSPWFSGSFAFSRFRGPTLDSGN